MSEDKCDCAVCRLDELLKEMFDEEYIEGNPSIENEVEMPLRCRWFYVNDDGFDFCGIKDCKCPDPNNELCEAYDPEEEKNGG